jgi:hypothetical protein
MVTGIVRIDLAAAIPYTILGCLVPGDKIMTAICILGMHRSGTSVITRLLQLHGLKLGAEDCLLEAHPSNPLGHFEHKEILEINETLLRHFGGSWDKPPKLPLDWQNDLTVQNLMARGKDLIDSLADSKPWGWKEPRTTVLLPFWQSLLPDLRYVICMRNPLEVAHSLLARNGMTIVEAAELWRLYTRAAIASTSERPRIFTFYRDYFESPLRELDRVSRFCGLEKVGNLLRCEGILMQEHRHQRHGTAELLFHRDVPWDCKLLYLRLRTVGCR